MADKVDSPAVSLKLVVHLQVVNQYNTRIGCSDVLMENPEPQPPGNRTLARRAYGFRVGLIVIFLVGCSGAPSISEYPTTIQCPDCPTMTVSRVIDGDTFQSPVGPIRLFGLDTPEKGERCFSRATTGLRHLAEDTVRVEPGPRARDPGGRLLYYVFTAKGNSIEEILVREGLARAWTRDGQHRDALARLERDAERSGTGCLW